MEKSDRLRKRFTIKVSSMLLTAGIGLLSVFPLAATAQVDCGALAHWVALDDTLEVNQKHVFCGEWSRNRPKGFHARPQGHNPETVASFSVQDKANAAGVYTGRWAYAGQSGRTKFSSMFPDGCSVSQVLSSIAHAVKNQRQCPTGAPDWTQCGFNQPSAVDVDSVQYCSVNNQQFIIAFAPPRNGRVNTAFPLFE